MKEVHAPEVTLLSYPDPRTWAIAAWASTSNLSHVELQSLPVDARLTELFESLAETKKRSPKELLQFLLESGHMSPFRHGSHFVFLIETDLASVIQTLKHRIGVEVNSQSFRYKQQDDRYLIPPDAPDWYQKALRRQTRAAHQQYTESLERLKAEGYNPTRAKELARYFVPYNKVMTLVVTMSLEALAHYFKLRAADSAQFEIQELAISMWKSIPSEFQQVLEWMPDFEPTAIWLRQHSK